MADRQFNIGGVQSAPADWTLPDSLALVGKAAYAHFNGSAAATPYKPCLRIRSDSGHIVCESVSDVTVAAGASADASWFRSLSRQGGGGGGGYTPPTARELLQTSVPYSITGADWLPWNHVSGSNLLNLANPQFPRVVTAGVYAVTVTVGCDPLPVGGRYYADLTLANTINVDTSAPASLADTQPWTSVSNTYFLTPFSFMGVYIYNWTGIATNFYLFNANVQRIS